jgi:anaerobic ribonucleoside-triphosphate reductase activating protein
MMPITLDQICEDPLLRVATRVAATEAEGPGQRYALWFQGCPFRCPGCCNPEYLTFTGGEDVSAEQIIREIETAQQDQGIEGISLLGGEPFAHAAGAVVLARAARTRNLGLMIYTGYTLEELQASLDPSVHELLSLTDLLVDGRYIRELPETRRRWIGSTNQRLHFLTDRYDPDDPCWRAPNTLEIRLHEGELTINGFPAAGAKSFWKGWKRKPKQDHVDPRSEVTQQPRE